MTHSLSPMLIETIRVTDGCFHNMSLHRLRMAEACRELYGVDAPALDISKADIPHALARHTLKCRVKYTDHIHSIEFEPYTPRPVHTLKMVCADTIDYHLKYADRTPLDTLRAGRGNADEVIIIKDGLVTDTSYSNLLLVTPAGWLTPSRPLLKGVMRRRLIESGQASEADITPEMLTPGNPLGITGVILINAMMPPGTLPPVPLNCVF